MTKTTTTTDTETPATDPTLAHSERHALIAILDDTIKRLVRLRGRIAKGGAPHSRPRKTRASTPITCPHPFRKHYGRGLCESCWSLDWRERRAKRAARAKTEGEAA